MFIIIYGNPSINELELLTLKYNLPNKVLFYDYSERLYADNEISEEFLLYKEMKPKTLIVDISMNEYFMKNNIIKNFITRSRHFNISMIIMNGKTKTHENNADLVLEYSKDIKNRNEFRNLCVNKYEYSKLYKQLKNNTCL